MGRAVVVLARAPSAPGKTRLTDGLTPERALALRQALVGDTIDVAQSSGARLFICYTPADAGGEFAGWLAERFPQRGDDLGARMTNAIADALAMGSAREPVILIGSDLPNLPVTYLEDAFARLETGADVVFGPAADGGYYLVGVRQSAQPPLSRTPDAVLHTLFQDIEWGTNHVLKDTLARAERAGLRVALVGEWFDVDVPADLERFRQVTPPWAGLRTRQWCRESRASR